MKLYFIFNLIFVATFLNAKAISKDEAGLGAVTGTLSGVTQGLGLNSILGDEPQLGRLLGGAGAQVNAASNVVAGVKGQVGGTLNAGAGAVTGALSGVTQGLGLNSILGDEPQLGRLLGGAGAQVNAAPNVAAGVTGQVGGTLNAGAGAVTGALSGLTQGVRLNSILGDEPILGGLLNGARAQVNAASNGAVGVTGQVGGTLNAGAGAVTGILSGLTQGVRLNSILGDEPILGGLLNGAGAQVNAASNGAAGVTGQVGGTLNAGAGAVTGALSGLTQGLGLNSILGDEPQLARLLAGAEAQVDAVSNVGAGVTGKVGGTVKAGLGPITGTLSGLTQGLGFNSILGDVPQLDGLLGGVTGIASNVPFVGGVIN